jgi:hypothetical protein
MSESFLKIPDVDTMHRNCLQVQQFLGLLLQADGAESIAVYDCGMSWLLTDAYRRMGCLATSLLELSNYYLIPRDQIEFDEIKVLKAGVPADD